MWTRSDMRGANVCRALHYGRADGMAQYVVTVGRSPGSLAVGSLSAPMVRVDLPDLASWCATRRIEAPTADDLAWLASSLTSGA